MLAAFVGDLLLPGGFGRLDLTGSDSEAFVHSLHQLQQVLKADTLLLSSHDYAQSFFTTWRVMTQENPEIAEMLQTGTLSARWQDKLAQQSLQLQQQQQYQCGIVEVSYSDAKALVGPADIAALLNHYPQLQIVDVREPHEQIAGEIEPLLPQDAKVQHWPLSQLAWALISGAIEPSQQLLLVCRSGNRSLLAAKILNRLGFDQVYNLKGGVALLS